MTGQNTRMSPLTAMFLGMFGVGAVGIASGAGVVLYAMHIIDTKAATILGFAENTVEGLPALLESLPPAVGELLNDRRAPDYAASIDVDLTFVKDQGRDVLRPVMTITNNGDEVVSLLAVRIAALDENRVPLRDWTEVVATPLAIDDNDWRGPLMPGATRYVAVSRWRSLPSGTDTVIQGAVEISEVRIWQPMEKEAL